MLAFASGTLVSALAFELFPEAVELGGHHTNQLVRPSATPGFLVDGADRCGWGSSSYSRVGGVYGAAWGTHCRSCGPKRAAPAL
jgi:hypothetical protein